MDRLDETLKYINHIRNSDKRDYAKRYAIWLYRSDADRETVAEPVAHHLTFMGAQSVRMRLHELKRLSAPASPPQSD